MNIQTFLTNAVACIKAGGPESPSAIPTSVPDDQAPVITDLHNGLVVVYLVDEGNQLHYVQQHHLAAVKGRTEALHELGLMNLSRLAQAKLRLVGQGAVRGLLLDGLFEASLLLLDDLWDGPLATYTPNGAVAAIPTRDVLAFCDAKSVQGDSKVCVNCARGPLPATITS